MQNWPVMPLALRHTPSQLSAHHPSAELEQVSRVQPFYFPENEGLLIQMQHYFNKVLILLVPGLVCTELAWCTSTGCCPMPLASS